jgi:hypothetical protein
MEVTRYYVVVKSFEDLQIMFLLQKLAIIHAKFRNSIYQSF